MSNYILSFFAPPTEAEMQLVYSDSNKRYLCKLINDSGFGLHMTPDTIPSSWEIPNHADPMGMEKLAAEYIEYRRDKANGTL